MTTSSFQSILLLSSVWVPTVAGQSSRRTAGRDGTHRSGDEFFSSAEAVERRSVAVAVGRLATERAQHLLTVRHGDHHLPAQAPGQVVGEGGTEVTLGQEPG